MSSKKGFGPALGCAMITMLLLVASVAMLYAYSETDDGYLGNESDENDTFAEQHQGQISLLLMVNMIFWGLTIIMCGVTLMAALAMI